MRPEPASTQPPKSDFHTVDVVSGALPMIVHSPHNRCCSVRWESVRAAAVVGVSLFVIASLICGSLRAETTLDSKKEIRLPNRAPLKWENLSDGLQHIAGPKPRFNRAYKLSIVELSPGEAVDFQVPENEFIRVLSCGDTTVAEDTLQIWTSDGTGLFRKLTPAVSTDQMSMVAAPDDAGISIGRVLCSPVAPAPMTVAVFTSARYQHRTLDYYQCPIDCSDDRVEISDDRGRRPLYYTPLKSGRRYPLEVEGSTRLRLETRLKYDLDASQHQFYWIKIFVDGVYHKTLMFDTLPQRMHREFVGGVERLIGAREFEYWDIENDCESVEIELSHPAYVRANAVGLNLCNPLTNCRFNFPAFEKQLTDEDSWLEQEWLDDGKTLDQYLQGDQDFTSPPTDPLWDPYLNYPRLLEVARDNSVLHGGLRAYMWMRAIASHRRGESDFGDEVSSAELVGRIKNRFTYFRDFTPIDVNPATAPRFVGFPVRSIRRPNQSETQTIVGEQHILEAAQRLPTTTLYPLATDGDQSCGCSSLRFRPQRSLGRTLIRWIVDRHEITSNVNIQVQYDDRPPVTLSLEPHSALPTEAFIPGRSEAALASLSVVHNRYDSGPWGGPFASIDQTAPMIQAGIAELILPADVREVKVTASSQTDQTIEIGCQILVAAYSKLSESAYLKHSKHASMMPEMKELSGGQLSNDSTDLQRLLKSHLDNFTAGIAAGNQLAAPTEIWSSQRLKDARTAALSAANVGNWPTVMEHLTDMVHHSKSQQRNDAIVTRTELLEHAGEYFLANRERRGWLMFSKDPSLKQQMLEKLLAETADRPNEDFNRENILSVGSSEISSIDAQIELAKQLAANGRYRFAFHAIPPEATGDEVEELRLRCCFQIRWWRSFKKSLLRVQDTQQRNFWGGIKLLQLGKYKRAFKLLSNAGQRGQAWITHWKYGDHVYARLTDPDFLTRMAAIEDWQRYLEKTPGPRVKQFAPDVVKSCYGAATIYSIERDLRYECFTSLQAAPAAVAIQGPMRISIESRPLHNTKSPAAINGVLEITNGSQLQRVPIINNSISSTLQIEGRADQQFPGTKIITEIDLPEGLNEIQLGSNQTDMIHRVSTWQPEIKSPVLPPINQTTLAAVVLGRLGNTHDPQVPEGFQNRIGTEKSTPDLVRLISREVGGRSLAHGVIQFAGHDLNLARLTPHLTEQLGDIPVWQNRILPTQAPLKLLHQDDIYQQAIAIAYDNLVVKTGAGVDDPSNDSDSSRMKQIASLRKLLNDHPQHQDLRRLYNHVKTGASWQRMEQFDRRAGVYTERVNRWRPDNPSIRIRKSLQGHLSPQRALLGNDPLILDLTSMFSPEIEVTLTRPSVGFLTMAQTTVMWEINGQHDQVTLKNHDDVQTFRVAINPNNTQLSLWMPQPYANHFVHVEVKEVMADGTVDEQSEPSASLGSTLRSYHVATLKEPLRFRVAGPNVIRVDQLFEGKISTQLISVTEPTRTFELVPEADQQVARYRIYEMDLTEAASPIYRAPPTTAAADKHWIDSTVAQVFEQVEKDFSSQDLNLLGLRSPDSNQVDVGVMDVTQLGQQERGTTEFNLGFRSRRPLDEFLDEAEPGQFFETSLTKHYFDQWRNQYRRTQWLMRPRLGSGPTFGFRHSRFNANRVVDDAPDNGADSWGPLNSQWNVYALGQYAGTPLLPDANSFPWTAGFSGSISRKYHFNPNLSHRPRLSIHGRLLSEDQNGFAPGELDQDIFTTYKRDHRYGLRFSDQFVYQCCLDRRVYLRPMLNSNEDQLIPDNAGFEIGSDQLFGPIEMHVDYRLTGFFADNDRTGASVQNVFSLDLKTEHWHRGGHRSEIDFSIRHAIDGGTSVGLFFNHFFNDGRGYRDFQPNSILFRALKQERAAKVNHFHPD